MAVQKSDDRWTEAEYLEFERNSDIKHEFANGYIVAMTGASYNHNNIVMRTSINLGTQLAGKDCDVIANDQRLHVQVQGNYRYPDVMVVCGEPEFVAGRTDTIRNPIVIVEVLSKSTMMNDRNDKLREYLQLESLQEYVLISQYEPAIERYLRQESGDWVYTQVNGLENSVELPSIGCRLDLSEVYTRVRFDLEDEE